MKHYTSLDEIKQAEIDELKNIPSMDEKAARSVYNFFRQEKKQEE